MKNSVLFSRITRKFDDITNFEIEADNIVYNNDLIISSNSIYLRNEKIEFNDISYVFIDKVELIKLQMAEFKNLPFDFFLKLETHIGTFDIMMKNSSDIQVIQEIFRLKGISIETKNSLERNN